MLTFRHPLVNKHYIYRSQCPESNSPIQGFLCLEIPHYLSKIWLVLLTNWHVPYYFGQKTLFCYLHAVFAYGQNVCPTNRVFPNVGDGRRSLTSQKFAHPPNWKNSSSRLHHSVHSLSAGGLDLLPNFQKGGLERISILQG